MHAKGNWIPGAWRHLSGLAALICASSTVGAAGYVLTGRISGPDGMWDYAEIDAASHRLYLAQTEQISMLDLLPGGTWSQMGQPGAMWHQVVPLPSRGLVLATNGAAHTLAVYELNTHTLLASIRTSGGATEALKGREAAYAVLSDPDALVLEPQSGIAAVVNGGSGDIVLVDLEQDAVVGTVHVGGKLEFAVADGRGTLFVNVETAHAIAVIDVARRAVLGRIRLHGCEEPTGLAYDSSADMLVSVCGNGVVKFMSATSGTELASRRVGQGADAVLLDAKRRRIFVPSAADARLYIFDIHDPHHIKQTQTLMTEHGVRLGALDALSGNLYLPAARLGPPVPPHPWPSAVAGTFHVLVVTPPASDP